MDFHTKQFWTTHSRSPIYTLNKGKWLYDSEHCAKSASGPSRRVKTKHDRWAQMRLQKNSAKMQWVVVVQKQKLNDHAAIKVLVAALSKTKKTSWQEPKSEKDIKKTAPPPIPTDPLPIKGKFESSARRQIQSREIICLFPLAQLSFFCVSP